MTGDAEPGGATPHPHDPTDPLGLEVEARRAEPAGKAFWSAITKAESKGLVELYAVEFYGAGEPTYEAVALIQTRTSSACLYASGELHAGRVEADGVLPALVATVVGALAGRDARPDR